MIKLLFMIIRKSLVHVDFGILLLYFGHSKKLVNVLDGGLRKMEENNLPSEDKLKLKKLIIRLQENKDLW